MLLIRIFYLSEILHCVYAIVLITFAVKKWNFAQTAFLASRAPLVYVHNISLSN